MQPELFEHFASGNHSCILYDCSIKLIDKPDGSVPKRRKSTGFENCSSLWINFFTLMVTPTSFYTFFQDRSLVNVKCILLFKSCLCVLQRILFLYSGLFNNPYSILWDGRFFMGEFLSILQYSVDTLL